MIPWYVPDFPAARFLQRKRAEYEALKAEIEQLAAEVQAVSKP
jgi:hypothetical protein